MALDTYITVFRNTNGKLNKHIKADGSKISNALLYEGQYQVIEIDSLSHLGDIFKELDPTDAIGLGIPNDGTTSGNIVTASNINDGAIARSKQYFGWNEQTQILLFDYDFFREMNAGMKVETPEQYRKLLIQLDDRLADVEMLIVPSSSAGIYDEATGDVVLDSKGMHCYIVVNNVSNIDVWVNNLFTKAWELELACIKFSKDGKQLSRTIFDTAVFSPERLVFEAPATLDAGLVQRATERHYVDGGVLDLSDEVLTATTDKEVEAFKNTKVKSSEIQADYITSKVTQMVADGVDEDEAIKLIKSRCEDGLIERDDVIVLKDGSEVVAKDLTAEHDGKYCIDPIEPDKAPSIVNVDRNGTAMIYSFLHGGRKFYIKAEEFVHKDLPVVLEPVDPNMYYEKFSLKWLKYGNVVTPHLQETWKLNCIAMNNACSSESHIKYVVPAATGSGKTEGIITYCTLLPTEIRVLITTNLTAEADRIASAINEEAGIDIAVASHSKTEIPMEVAAGFQIVVVSHEFYRRNYKGSEKWDMLAAGRDLILIDEALDTMKEVSVSAQEIQTAIRVVSEILSWKRYKNNQKLKSELSLLVSEYDNLVGTHEDIGRGTRLINSQSADKVTLGMIDGLNIPDNMKQMKASELLAQKYQTIKQVLIHDEDIRYTKILTTVNSVSNDWKIQKNILSTLTNLEEFTGGQLYVTANQGQYSYNKVIDTVPVHSVVCFDATADVNKIYDLRAKHHNDLLKVRRVESVRDYSTVNLYTAIMKTGKSAIDSDYVENVMANVEFGKKTLIITHKGNESLFMTLAQSLHPDKCIDVAHWGALTGLNDWQEFDTCVVVGLNHKPTFYAQNRAIVSTDEGTAFGETQQYLHGSIKITNLVAEIVQAINRIRVRKIVDIDGRCKGANIYLTLPVVDNEQYKNLIESQMIGINMLEWELPKSISEAEVKQGFLPAIISYLESNLSGADEVSINEPRDVLDIQKDSYRKIISKASFEQRLNDLRFEIVLKTELDKFGRERKRPSKYIRRIR